MSPVVLAALVVVGALALLVARGMWLLGQGTEAEHAARAQSNNAVTRAGWSLLDTARTADLPYLSAVEERLGINQDEEGNEP